MGLKHNIDTQLGVPATYFHIQRIDLYPRDGMADITVNGFLSYEVRLDGKAPAYSWARRIEIKPDATQSDIYKYLKTIEPFKGAQDK